MIINCGRGIHSWGSGTVVMNNSVINGSSYEGIYIGNMPADITLNNCVVIGSATDTENKYSIKNESGTCVANHCLLLPSPWRPSSYFVYNVTQNNCIHELPKFISGNFPAVVMVDMDDVNNFEDWKILADECEARGFRACFAMNNPYLLSPDQYRELAEYLERGHEVVGHNRTHSFLTETVAFNVSGPPNSRIVIDITRNDPGDSSTWLGTLDLQVDGVSISGDYPINLSSSAFNSIGAVVAKIASESGWACIKEDHVSNPCNSLTLAAAENIDVSSGADIPLDVAAYHHSEIFDCKKYIEDKLLEYAGYQYSVKSWVPAGNDRNETSDAALQSYGIIASRGGGWIADHPETYKLAALNAYNIRTVHLISAFGQDEDDTFVRNVAATVEALKAIHGTGCFYAHGFDSEHSLSSWRAVLDVIAESGIQVMTPSQLAEYVANNAHHTSDNGRIYYRCESEDEACLSSLFNGNYHLDASSPCIDAGIDVGLTQDFEGNPVPANRKPDIGVYEFGSRGVRAIPWIRLLLLDD